MTPLDAEYSSEMLVYCISAGTNYLFHLVYLRSLIFLFCFAFVEVATFSIRDTTGQVKTFRGDRMRHEQHPGQCESVDSFFSSFIALLLLFDSVASYLS